MIDDKHTVGLKQFDANFEPIIIDVIDFESKEVLHSQITIPKAARCLNIQPRTIHNFISRKSKRGYCEINSTKKKYIFKKSKT